MDGDGNPALVLHEEVGERGVGVVRDLRHDVEPRLGAGIDDHLAVDQPLEPVQAGVDDAVERQRVDQERDRSAAHDRYPVDEGHQPRQRVTGRGERPGERRVVDDRCQRPVEVDQHHGVPGVLHERLELGGDGHAGGRGGRAYLVPRITMQLELSAPSGGLDGNPSVVEPGIPKPEITAASPS